MTHMTAMYGLVLLALLGRGCDEVVYTVQNRTGGPLHTVELVQDSVLRGQARVLADGDALRVVHTTETEGALVLLYTTPEGTQTRVELPYVVAGQAGTVRVRMLPDTVKVDPDLGYW